MSDEITNWDRFTTLLAQARELFETQIDAKWLYAIVDDLPMGSAPLDQARRFLANETAFLDDYKGTQAGFDLLENLISDLRTTLLPVLREKLGISGFRSDFSFKNKDKYVVQHMVSYTFPHNLERMESLVRELRLQSAELNQDSTPLPDGSDLPIDRSETEKLEEGQDQS